MVYERSIRRRKMLTFLIIISAICSIINAGASVANLKKIKRLLKENKDMKQLLDDQFYLEGVSEVKRELPAHKEDK